MGQNINNDADQMDNRKKFEQLLKNKDFVNEMLSKKDFNMAKEFFRRNNLTINDEEIKKFCKILSDVTSRLTDDNKLSYKDLQGVSAGAGEYIDINQIIEFMSKW